MDDDEGRQLFCRIITPEKVFFDGEADRVIVRIADGDLGVLRNHAPVISTAHAGTVRILENDETTVFAISDGFFKVSENLVQVLVEEAFRPDEIDVDELESRIEGIERELSESSGNGQDWERRRNEAERRQKAAESIVHVAREYGEG